jgi:hypothetical protein
VASLTPPSKAASPEAAGGPSAGERLSR